MWRRWLAAALLFVGSCSMVLYNGTTGAAEPRGSRRGVNEFWLYDSVGARIDTVDAGGLRRYLDQATPPDTVIAYLDSSAANGWMATFAEPDTTDYFEYQYTSGSHTYVVKDSVLTLGWYVPKASVHSSSFVEGAVADDSVLAADVICPYHIVPDSTWSDMTFDSSCVVNLASLPSSLLLESEFRTWFGNVGRDSMETLLTLGTYDADFESLWAEAGSITVLTVSDSANIDQLNVDSLWVNWSNISASSDSSFGAVRTDSLYTKYLLGIPFADSSLSISSGGLWVDTGPSSGSATLVTEEDALQVKYSTSNFSEGASGLAIKAGGVPHSALTSNAVQSDNTDLTTLEANSIDGNDSTNIDVLAPFQMADSAYWFEGDCLTQYAGAGAYLQNQSVWKSGAEVGDRWVLYWTGQPPTCESGVIDYPVAWSANVTTAGRVDLQFQETDALLAGGDSTFVCILEWRQPQ